MAKLWEVIKAFQEGEAEKAERIGHSTHSKIVAIKTSLGISFYDQNGDPYINQTIDHMDLSTDWQIIEKPEQKIFARLIIVHQVMSENKETSIIVGTFENTSLQEVRRTVDGFPDGIVRTIFVVGINENGETTILVQEGKPVDA